MPKVRVLKDSTIGGADYKAGEFAEIPEDQVKGAQADGAIDPHKDAVAHCTKLGLTAETPEKRAERAKSELAERSEKR